MGPSMSDFALTVEIKYAKLDVVSYRECECRACGDGVIIVDRLL